MNKRLILGLVTLTSVFVLSACGSQSSSSHSTSNTSTSKVSAQVGHKAKSDATTTTSSQAPMHKAATQHKKGALANVQVPKLIWDNQKQAALNAFVTAWGARFSPAQEYTNYFPLTKAVPNFIGYTFPQDFSKNNIAVNADHVNINVSQNGADKYDYNVVSIYSDYQDGETMGVHLYLMTIHHGKPVVLITQQNQGMPDNLLHFVPTANQEIANKFAQLVNSPSQPIRQEPIVEYKGAKFDYRQIGVMVFKYGNPQVTTLVNFLGTNPFAGIGLVDNRLTVATRDFESAINYHYDQNGVHLTWNESGKKVDVSLADLVKATYQTPTQQNDVNMAAQMVPLS